jgi:hypothetical protein
VLEVNGMYRHGFMIAPAMLDVVLEIWPRASRRWPPDLICPAHRPPTISRALP